MFNADGSMRKTAKSKLLQSFSRQPVLEVPSAYISLVDMGLISSFARLVQYYSAASAFVLQVLMLSK